MRLTRYLTDGNAQGSTAQLRENESYRKNEDSEGNSYTLIQGEMVGSDGDQYIKNNYSTRKRTRTVRSNSHIGHFPWPQPGTDARGATGTPWGRQTQQVSSQDHSKKGQWTCYTHQWSQLPLVISGNCFRGHDIFGILRPQLLWPQRKPACLAESL